MQTTEHFSMSTSAVIVAAGTGSRLGGPTPKGFIPLAGKPLFLHSLSVLLAHKAIGDAVLVVPEGYEKKAEQNITGCGFKKKVVVVPGGKERWQSVENGVRAVESKWVLVHDAARPFVTRAVIDAVLAKKDTFDCAITATPEVDTVRVVINGLAGDIVDRSTLVRVGTPQLFRRALLLRALNEAPLLPSPPTDEAVIMQRIGVPVAIAEGDPMNFKITGPADLRLAEALIAHPPKK
jgi:2-C-methyl-D-erythritol 4-phosphate cytidylyltransferase